MAIMVVSLGFIYGRIFKAAINDFIPSLCAGLLVLGFLSSALREGTLFSYIKQVRLPFSLVRGFGLPRGIPRRFSI